MSAGSQGLLLFLLLLLSALASGSETALTALPELKIRYLSERHPRKAKALKHLLREPNDFITALLILNNLVNVGASALATLLFLRLLPPDVPSYVTGLVSTAVMTASLLLIGEITPKNWAKHRAETWTLIVINPVWKLTKFLNPLIRAFRTAARWLLRPFGVRLEEREEAYEVEEEELWELVKIWQEKGILPYHEGEMIRRILELEDTTVEEVMVPRTEMKAIEVNTPFKEVLRFVVEDGHSRYPVYEKIRDNIVGILYVKDLLALFTNGEERPLRELLRPVYYTPTTKPINVLLREFQRERVHMAVVVDEYGGVAGIVTLEDILEEIVGEIEDEYDRKRAKQLIVRLSENEALVDGDAEIKLVNRTLGLELPEDEGVTISGLLLHTLEDLPDPGARVKIGRALLTVEEATQREIRSVRITILPEEEEEER